MPKMPLSPENKAKNTYEYPKLFLDKGERARIALIETEPEWEWTHTLRAPQIQNGKPVYETVIDQKTKEPREVMKYDFVGRHICIGNFDIIDQKQVDVDGCPVCAESKLSDAVKPPERRFALNVVSYQLKHGSFSVQDPFQVELLVWSFGDSILNKLIDFADEWKKSGGLQKHDLLLGPCEVKQYQKFDINVAPGAEWLEDEQRKKLTAEVYKNNRLEDLSIAIGRRLTRDQVQDDLDRVMTRYNVAHGLTSSKKEIAEDVAQAAAQMDVQGTMDDTNHSSGGTGHDELTAAEQKGKKVEADTALDLDELLGLPD